MASKKKAKTEADKIWDEIENLRLNVFGLKHQKVHDYFNPLHISENELYLKANVTAATPVLEEAIRDMDFDGFSLVAEQQGDYLIVKRLIG